MGTYQLWEFHFQYPIILPFHTLHGVLKARILKWFAIPSSSGPHSVRMEQKCEKAEWLSEEALQIAVKRREVKSKGEKERYKHLNAEFQRIARRDKKAFLSDQCKEIQENNKQL